MTLSATSSASNELELHDQSKQTALFQVSLVVTFVFSIGMLTNGLIGTLSGLALIFILFRLEGQQLRSLGFVHIENIFLLLTLALVAAVLTQILASIVSAIIYSFVFLEVDTSRFDGMEGNLPMFLYWLFIGWTVAAFGEEIIWRGFLITKIAQLFDNSQFGSIVAVMISGLLFGLIHLWQGWLGFALTAIGGMVFAILFIKSRYRLWLCILTHGLIDTIGFLGLYVGAI